MTAKTSPMGWNSWDCWGAAVTEDIVRQTLNHIQKEEQEHGKLLYDYMKVNGMYEAN